MGSESRDPKEVTRELLLEHWGKDNPISSREINEIIQVDNVGSFPRTREIVRELLFEDGLPVASGGNGYYLIETEEELQKEVESLNSRISKTLERRRRVALAAANEHDEIDLGGMDLI